MEIVINIPEKTYEQLKFLNEQSFGTAIDEAVANGTPLPKGHGKLIDADELYGDFIDGTEGYDCQTWNRIEIGEVIDDAPTIIEADNKEGD